MVACTVFFQKVLWPKTRPQGIVIMKIGASDVENHKESYNSDQTCPKTLKKTQKFKMPVFAITQPLRKFDAKALFEVRRGVSDVVFREDSKIEVKFDPKPLKN